MGTSKLLIMVRSILLDPLLVWTVVRVLVSFITSRFLLEMYYSSACPLVLVCMSCHSCMPVVMYVYVPMYLYVCVCTCIGMYVCIAFLYEYQASEA